MRGCPTAMQNYSHSTEIRGTHLLSSEYEQGILGPNGRPKIAVTPQLENSAERLQGVTRTANHRKGDPPGSKGRIAALLGMSHRHLSRNWKT